MEETIQDILHWVIAALCIGMAFWQYSVRKKKSKYISNNINETAGSIDSVFSQNVINLINDTFKNEIPQEVKGVAFILHSDFNNEWELDILGTYNKKFLPGNEDWATDDFTELHETYKWQEKTNENKILKILESIIKDYLSTGEYANKLKYMEAVGLSSDDSNVKYLYFNK